MEAGKVATTAVPICAERSMVVLPVGIALKVTVPLSPVFPE
jgi:hypothetical protein